MYYIYILQSLKDKKLYIGFSENLKQRIRDHQIGKVKSTKIRRPFDLIYYEAYKLKSDARKQELFYKTGQGRRLLKKRLISYNG
jgi:putative endonuclease